MKKISIVAIVFFIVAISVFFVIVKYSEFKKEAELRREINSYLENSVLDGNVILGGTERKNYFRHENIVTTVFWVGEEASDDNGYIHNLASAWDGDWVGSFGGTDDPEKRDGFLPEDFTPDENPFYFALPFNDRDSAGKRKDGLFDLVPWADSISASESDSVLKNRWIMISKNGKTAFAQWQDVGPFLEDDWEYVFGENTPKNTIAKKAGLDVSPAVRDYLGLSGSDTADWQFVEESDVPEGPWKKIITRSQIRWK